jgi:hypothetical protein
MTRIAEQVRAGIDTVTDGEESQRYFVHGFLESLEGLALPPRSGKVERLCRRHSRADGQQANHFGFPQPIPKNPLEPIVFLLFGKRLYGSNSIEDGVGEAQ